MALLDFLVAKAQIYAEAFLKAEVSLALEGVKKLTNGILKTNKRRGINISRGEILGDHIKVI